MLNSFNVTSLSMGLVGALTTGDRPKWPLVIIGFDICLFLGSAALGFFSKRPNALFGELKQSETIMEDTTTISRTVDPTKKELPVATKEQLARPPIAYPTIALLLISYGTYIGSIYGFLSGNLPWYASTALSTLATYWSFTVLHDSVHIAISPKVKWLNELCGTLAGLPLFAPMPFFRYIHLNHHRYAGDDELDPDAYAGHGPMVLLPLRWATNLYYYIYYFARTLRLRSYSGISEVTAKKDIQLAWKTVTILPVILFALLGLYYAAPADKVVAPLVCILLPQHLAATWLIYLFDYIPHRPHVIQYRDDPFRSTNATSFLGSVDGFLWTSATLSQNLHIIHHLWPFMPFYTYKSLWEAHGEEIVQKGTHIVPLFITEDLANIFDELKSVPKNKKD